MGRAFERLGDPSAAALYLARAARPQSSALTALAPLDDREFAALLRAAGERPGDGPTQVRLISALLARGQSAEALARARWIQSANPGAPDAHILAGDVLGMTGDFAAAAEQYRRAANLAFNEAVALRLIEALQRSGQAQAAENVVLLFVRQNPRNVAGQILYASLMMVRLASAIRIYEPAWWLGDNGRRSQSCWAYSETGDEAAIRWLDAMGARPRQSGDADTQLDMFKV